MQRFDQLVLFDCASGCVTVSFDCNVDDVLDVFFGNIVSAQPVDDVARVLKACPEAVSTLIWFNQKCRCLHLSAGLVADADGLEFVVGALDLSQLFKTLVGECVEDMTCSPKTSPTKM